MYSVIPFNAKQRAMNSAIAETIAKRSAGKKIAEFPYATSFFRHAYGTSRPKKQTIASLTNNPDLTIPVITAMLDTLIESNGQHCNNLSPSFVIDLFPSLSFLEEHRFNNRFKMHKERDCRVQAKMKDAHKLKVEEQRQHVMTLTSRDLSPWVSSNEHWLTEPEMKEILREWYLNIENGDSFDFHCYYSELSARQIAFDLSLPA